MCPLFDDSITPVLVEEYMPSKSKSVNKIMASQRKEFKYKTRFNEIQIKAHLITDQKEKEKVITASVESLQPFLPNITENDYDLLAITANAYTVNLANRNNQLVGLSGIYAAKDFVGRFIDANHERTILLGYITNYGFSEFKTDKPLTEDEAIAAAQKGDVVNVVLGGVLWRIPNPELTDAIETASDPNSDTYNDYSFSWECAFENFSIAEGGQLLSDCTILSDEEKVEGLKSMLKTFGGRGLNERGRPMHLLLSDFKPLAVSAVKNPAAYVKGILVKTPESLDQKITSEESVNQEIEESIMTKEIECKDLAASHNHHIKTHYLGCGCTSTCRCSAEKTLVEEEGDCPACVLAKQDKNIRAGIEPAKFSTTEIGKVNAYAEQYGKTSDEYCAQLIVFLLAGNSFEQALIKTNNYFNEVGGVVVESSQFVAPDEVNQDIRASEIEENKNSILETVKDNITNNKIMKFKKITDLNDVNVKELTAAEILEAHEEAKTETLADAAKKYLDEIEAEKTKALKAETDLAAATESLRVLNEELSGLKTAQSEAKAEADFQSRMNFLSEEFELTDEARAALLDDIKSCSDDESFNKVVAKFKAFVPKKKKATEKTEEKVEASAEEILASLKADEPLIPNKEVSAESTVEHFNRVLSSAIKITASPK